MSRKRMISAASSNRLLAASAESTSPSTTWAAVEGSPEGRLLDSGPEYWRKTFELNLYSVLACSQAFARTMIDGGSPGVIVNIGSVQSQLARPGIAPYSATKGGIVMLTKGMCADLGPYVDA